jgi:DNA-binding MarR family transcriptional regulator
MAARLRSHHKPVRVAGEAKGVGRQPAVSTPINVSFLPNLLGYNLRRAQIALWKDFIRTVGATRSGIFSLLVLVEANPGIAQIDLANQLMIDKASIVGLIHDLQRRKWAERHQSSVDRRRQGIFLTAEGRRALKKLREDMLEHEARFTRMYTAEELGQLLQLLRRLHT